MRSRVQTLPSVTGAEIYIRAKKDWGSLLFLPIWLAFWTFGGIMAMKWVLHPRPSTPRAFISLWLVGWLLGESWALYSWLWTAFGKEVVRVKEGSLTVRRDVLGFGRDRSFPLASLSQLRARGIFPTNSYWGDYMAQMRLGGGTVAVDAEGKTVQFGIQLTEPQAQEVVETLKAWIPR
jgi:hypothetical protein